MSLAALPAPDPLLTAITCGEDISTAPDHPSHLLPHSLGVPSVEREHHSEATTDDNSGDSVCPHGSGWAWDINNSISARSTKLAVGAGVAGSEAMIPLLWVIP